MLETSDRVDQFRDEVAQLRLRGKSASQRERVLLTVSVVMMIAGIALAIGAYSAAQNVKVTPGSNLDVLNSNAYMPLSISGLTISVVGGFLFLRYSLAHFLRYWLLRQSYEQRVAIDEVSRRSPTG
jgi:hypothetical protein